MLPQTLILLLVFLWFCVAISGCVFWGLRAGARRQANVPANTTADMTLTSGLGIVLALFGLVLTFRFFNQWQGTVPLHHVSIGATLLSIACFMDILPFFLFKQLLPNANGNEQFWVFMSIRCISGLWMLALYATGLFLLTPATLGVNLLLGLCSVFAVMVASLWAVHTSLSCSPASLQHAERKILWYIARWRLVNFQIVAMVLYFVALLFPWLVAPKSLLAENGPLMGMFLALPFSWSTITRDSHAEDAWKKLHGHI